MFTMHDGKSAATIDEELALVKQAPAPGCDERRTSRQEQGGFTLIELAIVLAIIAILAAIALPSYQNQIRKSRRTSAKTAILDVASREEKYYATNNAYTTMTNLAYSSSVVQVPSSTQDYYNVSVTVDTPSGGYTATATAQGDQAKDPCGNYSITSLGVQSVSGTGTSCW